MKIPTTRSRPHNSNAPATATAILHNKALGSRATAPSVLLREQAAREKRFQTACTKSCLQPDGTLYLCRPCPGEHHYGAGESNPTVLAHMQVASEFFVTFASPTNLFMTVANKTGRAHGDRAERSDEGTHAQGHGPALRCRA